MTEPRPTEGERWTLERLEDLRRAGFTPVAVARFLVAAQRRANENRTRRPALARQARSWIAVGGLAWIVLALVAGGPFRRRVKSGLLCWGLTGLMLDWHLGMMETQDGHPRPLGAADACTLLRAWLAPIAADGPGPLVCGLALGTDALDGALARAGHPTRFGRDLEGVADAAFAAAGLRGAVRRGRLGRPAAAAEAVRLLAGALYTANIYFGASRAPSPGVAHAARRTTAVRAAGLLAAGLGRRRVADVLVWAGAAAGATGAARALRASADTGPWTRPLRSRPPPRQRRRRDPARRDGG